jgi:mycofactocin glycosyltransferase
MRNDPASKWAEALSLPGAADFEQSSLGELADYFGLSRDEARRACESALADSRREWDEARRRTTAEVLDFYDRTRSYIFEHVWWHVHDHSNNAANVAALDYALGLPGRAYLDFGSGVGANAILFARHGFDVTLADVSRTMLDFARWRMERRGLRANYVYLREQSLPAGEFDFITAVDVFEHLTDPAGELRRLGAALRVGGTLVFNYWVGSDPERPMHILASSDPIFRALRGAGLRRAEGVTEEMRRFGYQVVRRGGQSRLADLACGLYDGLYYSPAARLGKRLIKSALSR